MDIPVDFLQTPAWRDPAAANAAVEALRRLEFRETRECCEIKAMQLQALGLLHGDGKHFAIVYEAAAQGVWIEIGARCRRCEIRKNTWGTKSFIASSAARSNERPADDKAIVYRAGAPPGELLRQVDELRDGLAVERLEPELLGLLLHERLGQKWLFFDQTDDAGRIEAEVGERQARLATWVAGFVEFFRDLGFFGFATGLASAELAHLIANYDEPLFDLCAGVEAVVDDYDDFSSLLTEEELARLPQTSQFLDLKILAVLDPQRVWWSYRSWQHEQGYREHDVTISGREFVESLAQISNGLFEPESVDETDAQDGRSAVTIGIDGSIRHLPIEFVTTGERVSTVARVIAPDLTVVEGINEIIAPRGAAFRLFEYDGDESYFRSKYILMLRHEDREALESGRGWIFA